MEWKIAFDVLWANNGPIIGTPFKPVFLDFGIEHKWSVRLNLFATEKEITVVKNRQETSFKDQPALVSDTKNYPGCCKTSINWEFPIWLQIHPIHAAQVRYFALLITHRIRTNVGLGVGLASLCSKGYQIAVF